MRKLDQVFNTRMPSGPFLVERCVRIWSGSSSWSDMGGQPPELLLNGLVLDLVAGQNAAVDRYAHGVPPAGSGVPAPSSARAGLRPPTAGGVGRPGPSAAGPLLLARPSAEHADCAAVPCSPPW